MDGDIDSVRREAGAQLQFYWEAAEYDDRADLEETEDEIQEAYDGILELAEEDPISLTCLTVFALAKLRAQLNTEIGVSTDHFDDRYHSPAGLADDGEGRRLAAEVVTAADRALRQQPVDNLVVFARACALHWLDDLDAAAAGYREALRLDPYDDIARARVEELENTELPEPLGGAITAHPYGFHLLEMTHVVAHRGSMNGRVWLLNDPADVRRAADDYLDQWLKLEGQSLDQDFGLWTHLGGAGAGAELLPVVERPADGSPRIDWSRVPLPELGIERLPVGQPIRFHGQFYFFGTTEYDD